MTLDALGQIMTTYYHRDGSPCGETLGDLLAWAEEMEKPEVYRVRETEERSLMSSTLSGGSLAGI